MSEAMVKGIVIISLAAVLFLVGGFVGYSWCKRSYDAGIIDQQKKDAGIVFKHEEKKVEVKENVDKAIVEIKKIKDVNGCLDNDSPPDYLDGLLEADRQAESGFD